MSQALGHLADARNDDAIHRLRRSRSTSRYLRFSVVALAILMISSWLFADVSWNDITGERHQAAIARFARDIRPAPLRDRSWDWATATSWASEQMKDEGWHATGVTLAVSILAIVLAGIAGALVSVFAARNVMSERPFARRNAVTHDRSARRWPWIVRITRFGLVLLRCLPEYLLAFLFIGMFGLSAVPAVLALAIHNAGILGRLNAEVIENLPSSPLRALRAAGGTRTAITATAVYPTAMPRALLYFFYRWETCVRESTVLGLLSISTLGALIVDAEARMQFDRLFLFVLVGAALVIVGDLISAAVRAWVRQAR